MSRKFGKKRKTQRGFGVIEFTDYYGVECSLQQSSLATRDAIWLGCDKANPRYLVPGKGWMPVELPPQCVCDTRMHLVDTQVKGLIKRLQYWLEHRRLG